MNQAAPVPNPRPWLTLAVVGAAFFMTVLDVAIVNVAIPSIQRDLNIREETVQWVITAYAITFGGFLLLGGRMADLLGRRRIFVGGLILFTLASLVCGLANDAGVLITARAVQGIGAAIISPAALSIVTTTFTEGAERNKAAARAPRRASSSAGSSRSTSAGSGSSSSTCPSARSSSR
jgi:MFS family permease